MVRKEAETLYSSLSLSNTTAIDAYRNLRGGQPAPGPPPGGGGVGLMAQQPTPSLALFLSRASFRVS